MMICFSVAAYTKKGERDGILAGGCVSLLLTLSFGGATLYLGLMSRKQNHLKHKCTVCDSEVSDHSARNCPKKVTAYHGTTL